MAPVVEGSVRARQDRRSDQTGDLVVPINVRGDAAFSGQGVVLKLCRWPKLMLIIRVVQCMYGFTTNVLAGDQVKPEMVLPPISSTLITSAELQDEDEL